MKSVSMKQRLARRKSLKQKWMQKESVSKQGRKSTKSTQHTDKGFDGEDVNDAMDYKMTEDAHYKGRTSAEKGVSTEEKVSTDKPKVITDKPEVSTDQLNVSIDKPNEGTTKTKDGGSEESTSTPTTTIFRDDETIAEFLPLPKIDPKDKGKKVLEEEDESDAESKGVDEAERKFNQLAKDKEIARKMQEDWVAEEEKKKVAKKEATKAALIQDFDDIQARIKADRLLAARLQEEERENFYS
ncbi:hypothetical protein Tco_0296547 [Tanacetum coccineum]